MQNNIIYNYIQEKDSSGIDETNITSPFHTSAQRISNCQFVSELQLFNLKMTRLNHQTFLFNCNDALSSQK
jgi:hypothetical protein